MPDKEVNPLLVLAQASLYIPELARGVLGNVKIEQESLHGICQETLAEVHNAQRTLIEAGWRRAPKWEAVDETRNRYVYAPYSLNLGIACYAKHFNGEDSDPNWIRVVVASRFGISTTWSAVGPRTNPWQQNW